MRAGEHEAVALVKRSLLRSLLYTSAAAGAVAVAAPFVVPAALGNDFRNAATPLLLLLPGAVAYPSEWNSSSSPSPQSFAGCGGWRPEAAAKLAS